MKKVLKRIAIGFIVLFIGIFAVACIDGMNDDNVVSTSEKSVATMAIEEYTEEYNFNTEKTVEILKEYIPNYEDITTLKAEGTQGCAIYCDDDLMYYIIFYSDEHPEKPGELMSIDTAEEEYKNRTRLYQSY